MLLVKSQFSINLRVNDKSNEYRFKSLPNPSTYTNLRYDQDICPWNDDLFKKKASS